MLEDMSDPVIVVWRGLEGDGEGLILIIIVYVQDLCPSFIVFIQ
jgi:hypothetical protein